MSQNRPRTDGTIYAHAYLNTQIPSRVRLPEERRRTLDLLASEIRRTIHQLTFFPVPEHWALRVKGASSDLHQLEEVVRQTKGLHFIRENPPTGNTCEETPESVDPIEHR